MLQIAKLMQFVSFAIPPLAIGAELTGAISQGQLLLFGIAAISLFYMGCIFRGLSDQE